MSPEPLASHSRSNRAVFRFMILFVILLVSTSLLVQLSWVDRSVMLPYTSFITRLSGACLGVMDIDVTVRGSSIVHPRFSVDIRNGCDGLEATLLFVCATIAYPFNSGRRRALALLSGYALIFVMNLVRVVTLFFLGFKGAMRTFDFVHTYIAQFAIVTTVMVLWLFWISRDHQKPPLAKNSFGNE
jgi:exosortase H (IPTLxxWG-CTERM-specific)